MQHLCNRDLKWGKKNPINIQTSSNNINTNSSMLAWEDNSHWDGESDLGMYGDTGRNLLSASCEFSQTFFPTVDTTPYAL